MQNQDSHISTTLIKWLFSKFAACPNCEVYEMLPSQFFNPYLFSTISLMLIRLMSKLRDLQNAPFSIFTLLFCDNLILI